MRFLALAVLAAVLVIPMAAEADTYACNGSRMSVSTEWKNGTVMYEEQSFLWVSFRYCGGTPNKA